MAEDESILRIVQVTGLMERNGMQQISEEPDVEVWAGGNGATRGVLRQEPNGKPSLLLVHHGREMFRGPLEKDSTPRLVQIFARINGGADDQIW